jgi:hypothetical protein
MIAEWNIPAPVGRCAATGREFTEEERIVSALFWRAEPSAYERHDYALAAWKEAAAAAQADEGFLSSWRSAYKKPLPPPPETLSKDDAEGWLRRLLGLRDPAYENACYILALMLERKRQLKELDRKEVEGKSVLIYEHPASGETWIVPNPALHLDEMAKIQAEVAALLAGGVVPIPAAESAPEATPTPEPESESEPEQESAPEDEPPAETATP